MPSSQTPRRSLAGGEPSVAQGSLAGGEPELDEGYLAPAPRSPASSPALPPAAAAELDDPTLLGRQGGGRSDAPSLGPEARLQRALALGYRHLGKRDRTEAEVRGHLAAREIDEPSIDGALEALIRQGYVDDARYARTFAEDRRKLDDWGPERIERRLLALGVDPDLVASALTARDGAAELDAAVALLHRRFHEVPATERERERALALLARKGYDLELAYDAVRAFART